ncbi:MAG: bifunctional cytidylyltransferase/SDR family oxidoreductase [Desulfurococcales archaeon]|nr:bifunctional cytidylyltransferase/SDR family oxidoreductase [Desulfurococcales archaeon]
MVNVGVILCAGKGERFGGKKQFFKLAGKPVCVHTIKAFIESKLFKEIFLTVAIEDFEYVKGLLRNYFSNADINIELCNGGSSRQESSKNAIECIVKKGYPPNTKVLIHDGVRPFVDTRILRESIAEINEDTAVDTAVDAIDTIIKTSTDKKYVDDIPPRKNLMYGQTPQGFLLAHLVEMYKSIPPDKLGEYTDDCGIFLKVFPKKRVRVIKGSYYNIKITTPLDLYIADKIFLLKSDKFTSSLREIINNSEFIADSLRDKVIIVFGGTSGIGRAIVDLSRELGLKVYYTSKSLGVDIRNRANVHSFLEKVYNMESRIDHVIVTAGVLVRKPFINLSIDEIENQITTNYLGNVIVVKEAIPYLLKNSSEPKHIVLFSSSSYTRGRGYYSIYSSTKAAIVNFVQALCEEDIGINFNAIVPERTNTPMRRKWFGKEDPLTLLNPRTVAWYTLYVLTQNVCGLAFEVRKHQEFHH